jgi:hypothetical protein
MTKQMETTTTTKVCATPVSGNALLPKNIDEAMQMAEMLAQSDIVPKEFKGKSGNVLVAIQWGMEIGLPPLQALQNIAVISGRPSLWGDAVLALVRGSGKLEYIKESVEDGVATCVVKRKGEPEHIVTFSEDDAKKAGLWGKTGPWQQYPTRMLKMRARAFALRDVFPDVLKGVAIAEEVIDAEVVETEKAAPQAKAPKKEEPRHKTLGRKILERCGNDTAKFKAFVIETLEWPGDTELKGKWFDKLTDEELDVLEGALGEQVI